MNKIQEAFGSVRASEKQKSATKACLAREIERRQPRRRARSRALAAACAVFALVVGLGRFLSAPVAYVSVDVNPSVELALSRLERVVSATAYNDDGERILQGLDLRGMPYLEAVEQMLESEAMAPYLTEDAELTFTVAAGSEEKEEELLSGLRGCAGYQRYHAQSCRAGSETLQEAHSQGMSLGKYHAYCILAQYDPDATLEQCRKMTMAELHALIRGWEEGEDAQAEPSCESGSGHYGQGKGHGWGSGHA